MGRCAFVISYFSGDACGSLGASTVYLYLTNYTNKNSELAIMCINTPLNDWCVLVFC